MDLENIIIDKVRSRKYFFDKSDDQYKNVRFKDDMWKELSRELCQEHDFEFLSGMLEHFSISIK